MAHYAWNVDVVICRLRSKTQLSKGEKICPTGTLTLYLLVCLMV